MTYETKFLTTQKYQWVKKRSLNVGAEVGCHVHLVRLILTGGHGTSACNLFNLFWIGYIKIK